MPSDERQTARFDAVATAVYKCSEAFNGLNLTEVINVINELLAHAMITFEVEKACRGGEDALMKALTMHVRNRVDMLKKLPPNGEESPPTLQ